MPAFPAFLQRNLTTLGALVAAALLSVAWSVQAAPLAPGAPLPPLTLKDAHGEPVVVGADTQRVLFAASMAGSDLVNGVLATEPAGVLARLSAVYVADISRMPAMISRLVAVPRMRDLPFAVALLRDEVAAAALADVPREAGAVTVIHLESDRRVREIQIVRDAVALRAALGLAPVSQEAGEQASPPRSEDESRGQ